MELSHLKDIAAKLNMNVHHNIGVEKLTKQIKPIRQEYVNRGPHPCGDECRSHCVLKRAEQGQ